LEGEGIGYYLFFVQEIHKNEKATLKKKGNIKKKKATFKNVTQNE
jgi:hypothetical protein